MSILKVEPNAINSQSSFTFGNLAVSGNIGVGSAVISATAGGDIAFTTTAGAVEFNSNTVNFLSNVAVAGPQGAAGYTGSIGYTGSKGTDGIIGVDGYTGSAGSIGYTGSAGSIGYTGSKGADGTIGVDGYTGSAGSAGYTGSAGAGYTGSASSGGAGDQYYNNTSLLLHFDGSNGGTKTVDSSVAQNTLTFGAAASLSNAQAKFGTTSLATTSSSGSYVYTPSVSAGAPLDLSTGAPDWTVEAWAYPTALPSGTNEFLGFVLFWGPAGYGAGYSQISLHIQSGGKWAGQFNWNNSGGGDTVITSSANATLNAWTHLALTRSGNTAYFFVNGVQQATASIANGVNLGSSWYMGQGSNNTYKFVGYIDEARITKGVARYTANFTPASAAFPDFYSGIGYTGSRGADGTVGVNGYTGSVGYTGSSGSIGYTGSTSEATSVTVSPAFKGALVSTNTTQSIPAAAYTVLTILNTTVYDTNNFLSTANRFTIPAGVSKVKLQAAVSGASQTDQWIVKIQKNGSDTYASRADIDSSGADSSVTITPVLPVVQGDYFELLIFSQLARSTSSTDPVPWFAIEVVEGSVLDTTSVVRTTGYTGSAGTIVDFSVYSGIFPSIFVDGNSAADTTYDGTVWKEGTSSAGKGFEQGGMTWNATTGNVTVPQTGLYQVSWTAYHTNSGSEGHNQRFVLRKNGASYINPFSHAGMDSISTLQHTVTATINLNANDTISIAGDSTASWRPRIYGGTGHTYLQVVKISQVGYTGSIGSLGYTGSRGADGTIGVDGYTGSTGYTGSASTAIGYTGSAGSQGAIGYTGSAGTGGGGGASNIPPNNQTSAYTLVIGDVGKYINITTGGVTVPSGVFASGDIISIYNNSTSAQTITQGASVTMYLVGTSGTGNRTLAQRGFATVMCVGTNEFVISGGGLT